MTTTAATGWPGTGLVPPSLLPAALRALSEDRLGWRVTDHYGRACNGGEADALPVGRWSPRIAEPVACESGWHVTRDPLAWSGLLVWLVECDGELTPWEDDKRACERIRPLALVRPERCVDVRVLLAASRSSLGARLPDLSGASLDRASLVGARLVGASLDRASLDRARLDGASLVGASLDRASLDGASLDRASLDGASLVGASLDGASLDDCYMPGWERGPDGCARRTR
jgi:hypothetical protein